MKFRIALVSIALAILGTAVYHHLNSQQKPSPSGMGSSLEQKASNAAQVPVIAPEGGAVAPQVVAAQSSGRSGQSPLAATASAAGTAALGKAKRAWNYGYLASLNNHAEGQTIRFELVAGKEASGVIRRMERSGGDLISVWGDVETPEAGRFFFQKQIMGGKAGDFVGLVTFPGSKTAYRIEPTGLDGRSELVERQLEEVMCLAMPAMEPAALAALQAEEMVPPLDPQDQAGYVPGYNDGIISLQSLPGATAVLYIDYRGGYNDNNWGSFPYDRPNVSNAQIKDVWKRVAEDYMGFNVNVTTDLKVYEAAPQTSRQRVAVTPTKTAAPSAGGVAWLSSWNWSGDIPCWAFYTTGKSAAEVIAHEAGHTLTLSHDGRTAPYNEGYYGGQGSGATGWAPIMGVGYYQPVAQWCKGEYAYANNTEDDLSKIVGNNNSVDYRLDDTGSTLAASRYLEIYTNYTVSAEGVIETTGDTDAFRFTTTGGAVSLSATPVGDWSDLAVMVTLADSTDTIIASNNPQTVLSASIATNLPAGTYTFRVTGAGRNDPLSNGFSSYASLGYYSVSGTVAGGLLPTRLSVAERAANGTVVGTVPAGSTNGALAYAILSGNTGGTFSIDSSGVVRVANNTLLDYFRLATNTLYDVRFEMFLNITNLDYPAQTELNRRVLVNVLNVNDAPVVTGFTNTIIEHTLVGTLIGTVATSDPDLFDWPSFSIVGGNANGAFAIDAASGAVTVASDIQFATQSAYTLAVAVNDNAVPSPIVSTGYVTINIVTNFTPFRPGTISYALYDGIGSAVYVTNLTYNSRFPTDPTSEKQISRAEGDTGRGDSYGSVLRGYLIPPASGNYTFYIASDDNSELRFSTTTNPASAVAIANVTGASSWTDPRQWTKYASQKSATYALTAGQGYYIEARQKEGSGGDNFAVGWSGPATGGLTNVISGLYLAPYRVNYVPHPTGFTATVRQDAFVGTRLGTVTATDVNTGDTDTFAIISGNAAGVFAINSASGAVTVSNDAALLAGGLTTYNLQVRVTDSGVPALSSNAAVTINVVAANGISATGIRREMFNNIGSGTAVTDLTGNAKYPGRPDALTAPGSFASPSDVGDSYGSRIRALLVPSVSGDYQFFIAADDNAQLKLSATTNPATATVIASVSSGVGWTSENEWTKYSEQASAVVTGLVAGQAYYIEALHKEGGGGDHVEVGWVVPGSGVTNVIPGANLQPVDLNYAPTFSGQAMQVVSSVPNGTQVGVVSALDSPLDTLTYKLLSGNTGGAFALDPASGALTVVDNTVIANGSVVSFALVVAVQDSGYGGLYPLRTSQGTVTVTVASTNSPLVWTGAAGSNNWASAANWGGGTVNPGARLIFGAPLRQANVNDAATALGWVLFTNGGFSISGNPLVLQAGLTNVGGATTWGLNTTLAAAQTWHSSASGTEFAVTGNVTNAGYTLGIVANNDFRISGSISGSGGLNKSGTTRLLFQGTHTYTGPTVVAAASGGALEVNGANDLNIGGSDLTMNGIMDLWNHSATIGALNGSGTIYANDSTRTLTVGANNSSGSFSGLIKNYSWASSATLGLVKTGTGTQTLTASNTFSAGTTINAGTLSLSGAGSVFAGPVTIAAAGTLAVDTTSATKTDTANLLGSGTILKTGANNLVLQGNNSFSGLITVNGGYLVMDSLNAAAGQPGLNLGGSGSMAFGVAYVGGVCTVSSLAGSGAINTAYGATTGTRTLAVNQAVNSVFSGVLADGTPSTRVLALQKSGVGNLVLSGANTYGGLTTVSGGTLTAGGGSALGAASGGTVVNAGASLALTNSITIATEALTLNGAGFGASGALRNDGGTNTFGGAIALASPATIRAASGLLVIGGTLNAASYTPTFDVAAGAGITVSNTIAGTGGLTKSGQGVLTLAASSSYAGTTTISAGSLVLGAAGSINSSASVVLAPGAVLDASLVSGGWYLGAGQTLQGNGSVAGPATLNGTLAPGASIGTLAFSGTTILSGTTVMEVSLAGPAPTNDLVTVSGALNYGGALVLTNISTNAFAAGQSFKLFQAGTYNGAFASVSLPELAQGLSWDTNSLAANGTISVVLNTYTLTYAAGPNGTITGTTPQTVNYGASGTVVTAVPDSGYAFTNWSDGLALNPRTDAGVTNNITVTANFVAINTGLLPAPWTTNKVGTVAAATTATYTNGVFTVAGAGANISGKNDNFWYVNQAFASNATFTARVVSEQNTGSAARAGVMMRESLAGGSRSVFMGLSPSSGAQWVRRSSTSGNSSTTTVSGRAAPHWVRLTRNGGSFTGYISADGLVWTQVARVSLTMSNSYRLGLAVCSSASGTLSTSVFDSVSVTNAVLAPSPITPQSAVATIGPITFEEGAAGFTITGDSGVTWQLQESSDCQTWSLLQYVTVVDGQVRQSEDDDARAARFFRLELDK